MHWRIQKISKRGWGGGIATQVCTFPLPKEKGVENPKVAKILPILLKIFKQSRGGGGYPRLNPPLSCLELELMSYTVVRNVIVKWDVDQVYFLNGFCRTRPSKLSIHVYLCKTRKTDRHHFYPMANLCARDGEFRLKGKSFMTWIFFLPPVHLMFCAQKQ